MMSPYNLNAVYDYIWGKDLDDDMVDSLENNPYFMIQVMEKSKDKNVYNLCSDTVKRNYDFVKKAVELFGDDLDFVSEVAENYLSSLSQEEIEQGSSYAELNIMMSNLYGRVVNNFTLRAASFYEMERIRQEACSMVISSKSMDLLHSDRGFIFTVVQYEDSNIIIDYVADRMSRSAFYGDYGKLETLVHKRFRSLEDLKKYGEKKFLYDCLFNFDQALADYVFSPTQREAFAGFFEEALGAVDRLEYMWPRYMDRLNSFRVDIFYEEVSRYLAEQAQYSTLEYDDVACYVAHRLNVVDLFKKYDFQFSDDYNPERYNVLQLADVKVLSMALNLMSKNLSSDVIVERRDSYVDDDKDKMFSNKNLNNKIVEFHKTDGAAGTKK